MKNILIVICLLANYFAIAQKLGEQAVFMECIKEKLPADCTNDKMTTDITALITGEIITELEKSGEDFFSVSLSFVTDENGKITPLETEIRCEENAALKKAIENYLSNLPAFYPKDKDFKERRSAHILNITYLQNSDNPNYHIATPQEVRAIQTPYFNYISPDTPAIYPGCEEAGGQQTQCLAKSIMKDINENYVMPRNITAPGKDKMHVSLIIPIDGKVRVEEIAGSSKPFQNEVFRTIKKVPKLTPAYKKGIPVATHINVPVVINVK